MKVAHDAQMFDCLKLCFLNLDFATLKRTKENNEKVDEKFFLQRNHENSRLCLGDKRWNLLFIQKCAGGVNRTLNNNGD